MGFREIIFKANRIDNGEWVEGALFYSYNNKTAYIVTQSKKTEVFEDGMCGFDALGYEVEPDTICQYTGLCDKNGRKIFENDIIRVCTNGFDREVFETKVLFGARSGVQGFYLENGRMMFYWGQTDLTKMDDAEVIGNSFDSQKE